MVDNAAGHALGLLIAKVKLYGGVPYDCYIKLYNALDQPIIDYGASIWGIKEYTCVAAVQHRACRFFMGVGKYTPNCAFQGDMGWTLPGKRQWTTITWQWCHLMTMDTNRINKQVFTWTQE